MLMNRIAKPEEVHPSEKSANRTPDLVYATREAGSKVNWAALESEVVDKIFFYYAPKILGGLHSLPVVGGVGRRRRSDAIVFRDVTLHNISADEFAVEAWLVKGG